jgi:hypothetical protein
MEIQRIQESKTTRREQTWWGLRFRWVVWSGSDGGTSCHVSRSAVEVWDFLTGVFLSISIPLPLAPSSLTNSELVICFLSFFSFFFPPSYQLLRCWSRMEGRWGVSFSLFIFPLSLSRGHENWKTTGLPEKHFCFLPSNFWNYFNNKFSTEASTVAPRTVQTWRIIRSYFVFILIMNVKL